MDIKSILLCALGGLICLTGCQAPLTGPFPDRTPSQSTASALPASLPKLAELSVEQGTPISKHDGMVLDIREVRSRPAQVVSLGTDGAVIGWDVRSGQAHLLTRFSEKPTIGTFGKDVALVAYATLGGVTVTCVAGCSETWKLSRLRARVSSLAFHENDSALLIGGSDGRVYRWRFLAERSASSSDERDRVLERYIGHQTMVSTVAALPVGRAFFSADWDGALLGWLPYTADDFGGKYDKNLNSGGFFGGLASVMRAARPLDRGISSLTVSEDGSRIIVGSEDGAVELWNVRGFNLVARMAAHQGRVVSVSTNRDGSLIVSVGRDSNVTVLRAQDDPMHLVKADSLPKSLSIASSQRVENVKGALVLSSGDVLITTAGGGLGELKIDYSTQAATPANTQQNQNSGITDNAPSPVRNRVESDSDY